MSRRKIAGAPTTPHQTIETHRLTTLLQYHVGALEEIRREAEALKGGALARILKVCETMLGPSKTPPRKSL